MHLPLAVALDYDLAIGHDRLIKCTSSLFFRMKGQRQFFFFNAMSALKLVIIQSQHCILHSRHFVDQMFHAFDQLTQTVHIKCFLRADPNTHGLILFWCFLNQRVKYAATGCDLALFLITCDYPLE